MASMQDIVRTIEEKRKRIAMLKAIVDKCDPASGITVYARLGALMDDASHLAASGVAIEVVEERFDILALMIAAESKSLAYWMRKAETYRDEITKVLGS